MAEGFASPVDERPAWIDQALDASFRARLGRRLQRRSLAPHERARTAAFDALLHLNAAPAACGFGWLATARDDVIAAAVRHPVHAFGAVGLAAGLPALHRLACEAIFAEPSLLPLVGEIAFETPRASQGGTWTARLLDPPDDTAPRPRDATRARAAALAAALATEFVVLHQCQHLFGAHFERLADEGAPGSLVTTPRVRPAARAARQRGLELHADAFAMTALAQLLARGHSLTCSAAEFDAAGVEPERLLALAVLVALVLEAEGAAHVAEGAELDHPSPVLRLVAMVELASATVAATAPDSAERLRVGAKAAREDLREISLAMRPRHPFVAAIFTPDDEQESTAKRVLDALRHEAPALGWRHELVVPDPSGVQLESNASTSRIPAP